MTNIRAIINTWPSLPVKLRSRSLCSSPLQISLMEENDVVQKFHELFRQNKYKEASELAVESIEITEKYLKKLKKERDTAVNQKDQTFKKLEELRKPRTGETSSPHSTVLVNRTEFSYPELQAATDNFNEKTNLIKKGDFGIVYKGFLRSTNVAIKILAQSRGEKEFDYEVKTLNNVSHPNLVSLIGVHNSPYARAIVCEFLSTDSLQTYLTHRKKRLSWPSRIRIASEICSALIFLHSIKPNGIVHGNLNPDNILLDSNMTCKLSDFGMSRELDQKSDRETKLYITNLPHGVLAYMDPEFSAYHELTAQSDVFSFGIILLQLVTGKGPRNIHHIVERAMNNKQLHKEFDVSAGKVPINEATELASLGLACSSIQRSHRPDLAEKVWPKIESLKHALNLH